MTDPEQADPELREALPHPTEGSVVADPAGLASGSECPASISVEFVADATLNYALLQNRIPVIKRVRVANGGESYLNSVELRISTQPGFGKELRLEGGPMKPGEERVWSDLPFEIEESYLEGLRESLVGRFEIEVSAAGNPLHSERREVELLATDHWNGLRSLPELLAAFVQPNARAVEALLADAAERLVEKGERLDGYQSRSRQRAAVQTEAIFAAIQARGVHYANPPASFERSGQKVRLPQRILDSGLATCLDTTLLLCACLEQAGLHPLAILTRGHAFCGVWLEDETFAEAALDSHSRLKNRVDLDAILPVETTLLCEAGAPFASAVDAGRRQLADESKFGCLIDIVRCRRVGVRPLPLLDDGKVDEEAAARRRARAEASQRSGPSVDVDDALDLSSLHTHVAGEHGEERLDRWKRNLLDLSLHNRLLNFKASQRTLSLLSPGLAALEDALAGNESFTVAPSEFRPPEGRGLFDLALLSDEESQWVAERFQRRLLFAPMEEKAVYSRLTGIYRAARLSIEESGSNTLYLALCFLRWRRSEDSERVYEAPLLLIPLSIERKSVRDGYRLARSDEETVFNSTLLELLKVEFGLEIPGLDPLPEDESGVDVPRILKLVRHAISDWKGWTVVEAAEVGLFSFAKFLMWRDLEAHSADLRANPLVGHLMRNDGSAPDFVDPSSMDRPEDLDATRHPAKVFAPLSADSSQLAAIHAATEGHTFVLEGPPGTGKSQTIANLIVNALGKGRTVLFVAEKRAALEVVHRRLSQIGLGEFVLELHSNKANKVDVLRQLAEALNAKAEASAEAWTAVADALERRRGELNGYVEALHRRRPAGLSVWEGINRLVERESLPLAPLDLDDPERLGAEWLERAGALLAELGAALEIVGDPLAHPFADCMIGSATRAHERAAAAGLARLGEALGELEAVAGNLCGELGLESDSLDGGRTSALLAMVEWLASATRPVSESLLAPGAPERALALAKAAVEMREAESRVAALWHEAEDAGNHAEWARRVREVEASGAVGRFFGQRKLVKELRGRLKAGRDLTWSGIGEAVEAARGAAAARDAFQRMSEDGPRLFGESWNGGEDPDDLKELASLAALGGGRVRRLGEWSDGTAVEEKARALAALDPRSAERAAFVVASPEFRAAFEAVKEAQSAAVEALGWQRPVWTEDGELSFAEARRKVAAMEERVPDFREWRLWLESRSTVEAEPLLSSWLPRALEAKLAGRSLAEAFEKAFLTLWVDAAVDGDPHLSGFLRQRHEGRIDEFRQLDEEHRSLATQVVRARLAAKIPQAQAPAAARSSESEMGVLVRELQKRRRHLPVRKLLEQMPRLLRLLKPCLLMSPLSVAQYLRAAGEPYDIVLFDEASQITPWDALGALARGRSAVVVGDPKQLPPTSFFQRATDLEESDENIDLESILDECLAARLPCKRLGWHYRSRHESLITFSNHRYYGNGMLTFPSTRQQMAVRHIHVADGHYDKGRSRTNRAEAERVVSELVQRLSDPERSSQSLGVVTFSSAQQFLVEELLDRARAAKPELEPWFSDAVDEPVFVKNLESVQGDERDVIIFSIGYGPDLEGRVSMNFGPLNRDGGQRRLNVAITRAREEVLVVSSLLPEHIDLARTAAPGVGDLRSFLEFAMRGPSALANLDRRLGTAEHDSPFEAQVAEALRARGYEVHPQVGCSGYRVDLGVLHPEHPDAYLLGVECDGASYHSSRNARDRDKLRQAVLEGLGWSIARVWSTDWWRDPGRETDRLVARIEEERGSWVSERKPPATNQPKSADAVRTGEGEVGEGGENGDGGRGTHGVPSSGEEGGSGEEAQRGQAMPWEIPRQSEETVHPAYRAHRFAWPERPPEIFHEPSETPAVHHAVAEVLAAEAPISESLLAARVRAQWGLKSSGRRIVERVAAAALAAGARKVVHGGRAFYWAADADPGRWSSFRVAGQEPIDQRAAEDLPPEEVAAAAHAVLSSHVSLTQEGLVQETARLLGYRRTGRKVVECIAVGVELLVSRGVAEKE